MFSIDGAVDPEGLDASRPPACGGSKSDAPENIPSYICGLYNIFLYILQYIVPFIICIIIVSIYIYVCMYIYIYVCILCSYKF